MRRLRCRDIDPVEDTERCCSFMFQMLGRCCRDIDPVEDTESEDAGNTGKDE